MGNGTGTDRRDGTASATRTDRNSDVERLAEALKGIRFGEVRAIVQDGVIVQIERLEKSRLR